MPFDLSPCYRSWVYNTLLLQRFDFLCEGFNLLFERLIFPAAPVCEDAQRVALIARIAKGIPMQAMMMLFCRSKFFSMPSKRSLTFTFRFLTSVVSTARSVLRGAMSTLISELPGGWARKGMAMADNSIERSKIVFMGCSSSSLMSPPAKVLTVTHKYSG